MPQTMRNSSNASVAGGALLSSGGGDRRDPGRRQAEPRPDQRGFGAGSAARSPRRKGGRKRGTTLSKADWGPLGKHPDLDAIVARRRLQLPLSGRLTAAEVNQAWKRCAAEHHPDRGGEQGTMQLVNGARDLLLGRDLS